VRAADLIGVRQTPQSNQVLFSASTLDW
jgi:hypothetical protein